jgi:hypothetical protein
MQYTETELAKLIETVEQEFTSHLSKAEEVFKASSGTASIELAKAEDSKPPKKEESKPKDEKGKPPAASKEAPAAEEGAPEAPAEEMPPEGGEAPAAPAEGQPNPAAQAPIPGAEGAGNGYDEEDMAHMDEMYMSMSYEELMAHHDAVRRALDAQGGAQQAPAAGQPPAAAPGAGIDKCGTSMMGKAEKPGHSELSNENPTLNSHPTDKGDNMFPDPQNGGIEGQSVKNSPGAKAPFSTASGTKLNKGEPARRNGGKIDGSTPHNSPGAKAPFDTASGTKLNKSEGNQMDNTELELAKSELEAEKAKTAEMKKNLDGIQEFLTKLVKKVPQGKAITELGVVAKSEDTKSTTELSETEINKILNKKAGESTLAKSDRDAINDFYLGDKNFNKISHLLK